MRKSTAVMALVIAIFTSRSASASDNEFDIVAATKLSEQLTLAREACNENELSGNIKRMKAIQSDWGGMKVGLEVLESPGGYGTNRMNLEPFDDFRNCPKAREGASGFGGNRAHINTSRSDWVGAAVHDLLHLAGAPEGYSDEGWRGGRISTPKLGYTNDHIMADRNGSWLTGTDVDDIIGNDTKIKTV